MSRNDEKETGNSFPGTSERVDMPPESDSEFKKYAELYENDEVVKRQMEMISESLAACKRMSKRRSTKKEVDVDLKPEGCCLEIPIGSQPDERSEYHGHFDVRESHSPVVSYILKENMEKKNETPEEKQEIFSDSLTDPETFSSLSEVPKQKETSQVGMYKPEEVDPTKMMEVIQRELKCLLQLAPMVSSTVNELFDTIHHYQSCSKCKAKIRSSLPWILNTIQELIKHVTKKRRGTYVWPNECSYLHLSSIRSLEKESLQRKEEQEEVGKDTKQEVILGKLEKVDAITTSDFKPGLQIQLEVKPEKTKKKFFSRKIQLFKSCEHSLGNNYSTELPKESSYNFLFQVAKPSRPPEISWTVKRSILVLRGIASAVWFLTQFRCLRIFSGFVPVPVSWVRRTSNGVERKMQVEKMKELEAEVKGLKDLMLEVHKNQMELSKVLMEKGVYSQTIIRLTDPKMLEEENEIVRKAAHMEITQQQTCSIATLQRAVDDLKRKCAVKNRMIVTLLKGLHADVPNEWCEELVDYIFTDSKSNVEFEPEKMSEFVRQTSAYLHNQKTSKEPWSVMQEEEKPSEASLGSRATSGGSSSKDGQEYSDASSLPGTENPYESETESDYKTGIEDLSEDNCEQSRTEIPKSTANGFTEVWETSSFVQNLLYEDSQTGVAVVDLFVAVKSAKNSIDDLVNLNNTVHEMLASLSQETGLIQTGYENLVRTMTSFFDRVKAESKAWKSESVAIRRSTVKSIHKPEVNTVTNKSATEIGRFCSSCGLVRYIRENVTCPLCKGEIIVREKCSDCVAVEQSVRRTETKYESSRLSICQYCGLPELKNKKTEFKCSETESNLPKEVERSEEAGKKENVNTSFEQVQTSPTQQLDPSSPSLSPVAPNSGGSIPTQTSSKVVESLFQSLVSHVLRSETSSKSTTTTRESLLSSLLTSKSGIIVSHEDSKKASEGTMSLSDTTVQMICEICEILGLIGPQARSLETTSSASKKTAISEEMQGNQGDNPSQRPSSHVDNAQLHHLTTVSGIKTNKEHENSIITIYLPESLTSEHEDKTPEKSTEDQPQEEQTESRKTSQIKTAETEDNSEGDIFEEALSEPYTSLLSCNNCMGDLTKEVTKVSKSVSTLTSTNEFVSSWIGKIAEDIKTKIKNLKSGSKQVSVTDEKTSYNASKKHSSALEFVISADTPVGVFDVTIRQYRDSRRKLRDGTLLSGNDKPVSVEMETLRGDLTLSPSSLLPPSSNSRSILLPDGGRYWSDESLLLSNSDHLDLASGSEDELEEFIEVYVQNRKKTVSTCGLVSKPEIGLITEMCLIHGKPSIMEMVRCQPKTFVQEIIPKTEKFILRQDGRQETREGEGGKMTPEVEINTGSMVVPEKGSGGRRNDEEQGSPDSPNNSDIIDRSFNDLVICIQIDVDDEDEAKDSLKTNNQIYIDVKVGEPESSKNTKEVGNVYLMSKQEMTQVTEDVKDIWTRKDFEPFGGNGKKAGKGRITFNETPIMLDKETENSTVEEEEEEDDQTEELESMSYETVESDDSETERMMNEESVTLRNDVSELLTEKEIKEVILEPEPEEKPKARTWARADTIIPIQKANQVAVHYLQDKRIDVIQLDPRTPALSFFLTQTNDELQKALSLIQEIETNIMNVKLSEAINILPVLESELRKHLRDKIKGMTGGRSPSRDTSVDNFFSALEVWPRDEIIESSQGSEERFKYLLKLLSDLEEAVKSNEYSTEEICRQSSSRIYNLLNALTNNIRGLEEDTTMGSLSETVDIASQLDTAVRELDDILKKKPADYVKPDNVSVEREPNHRVKDEPLEKDQLTDVRKRVFEMVEEDAIETEERIEIDFDRIDRLERENEESMKFVEAFLEKTLRRSSELTNLRTELKNLSSVLGDMYEELSKAKQRKERSATRSSSPPTKEVPVRDTVSSLLLALDKLKTRAREKNEACKEILGTIASATSNKGLIIEKKGSRSSKSSYTTKSVEGVASSVKEFKKIGQRSLYLAWSKPEGILSGSIVGYEILVNGKLNQKVRNPHRQQAVLYSVDLSQTAEVQLLGLIEDGSKVLLAIVTYLDL